MTTTQDEATEMEVKDDFQPHPEWSKIACLASIVELILMANPPQLASTEQIKHMISVCRYCQE